MSTPQLISASPIQQAHASCKHHVKVSANNATYGSWVHTTLSALLSQLRQLQLTAVELALSLRSVLLLPCSNQESKVSVFAFKLSTKALQLISVWLLPLRSAASSLALQVCCLLLCREWCCMLLQFQQQLNLATKRSGDLGAVNLQGSKQDRGRYDGQNGKVLGRPRNRVNKGARSG
jgi:hypothetical protein